MIIKVKINNLDTTTRVYVIYLQGVLFWTDYMFLLSSLGHHLVVSHYGGNYTVYGMIQHVHINIVMIQRDLVFISY